MDEPVESRIHQVFALPEAHAARLSVKESRFGGQKIDLYRLEARYIFEDIQDLKDNYRRLL